MRLHLPLLVLCEKVFCKLLVCACQLFCLQIKISMRKYWSKIIIWNLYNFILYEISQDQWQGLWSISDEAQLGKWTINSQNILIKFNACELICIKNISSTIDVKLRDSWWDKFSCWRTSTDISSKVLEHGTACDNWAWRMTSQAITFIRFCIWLMIVCRVVFVILAFIVLSGIGAAIAEKIRKQNQRHGHH